MPQQTQQINQTLSELVDDPEREKEIALENFRGSLVIFLDASSEDFMEILVDYNSILIMLLATDVEFSMNLRKTLVWNSEKLTEDTIMTDGKVKDPTVSNWIADFVKFHGSNIFNSVILSKYMTSSPNVIKLQYNERRLVKKLLLLYHNLVFFPDSLKDTPPEYWEIFPIDRQGGEMPDTRHELGVPKTEEEKEVEKLKNMEGEYKAGSLEQLALEEEIVNRKKIDELKMMIKKYPAGSLERRVVEEEIAKMEINNF